ncbi:protein JINGUBANG-like [Mangifera indica]|uniref:protein JINGUBANG-like n=1 Tax=Mangifera indica TaxID=29780 RepID=UPI001CFB00F9|nr:protein JINGUBANG-like [Mangifera indica]
MKVRSWLAICTTTSTDSTALFPKSQRPLLSDTSSSSDIAGSSTSISDSSYSSLQSNLSLQTLPSVPSLQKISSEDTANFSFSQVCITSLKPKPKHPIGCIAIRQSLLYAASAHEINVYDRNTWSHLDTFNNDGSSSGSVKSIAFCNGKIFTAHQDGKIRVWQLTPRKRHNLKTTLPTVNDRLRRFIFPKNYVNVRRHRRKLWIEHADAVTGLTVDDDLIFSVSWDKSLKIWQTSDLRCSESIRAHEDAVNAVAVSADGTVYTGSADKRIRVWAKPFNEKRYGLTATLEKHKSAVNALALSDDGSVLFSGACDRSILVWEREDSANHMVVRGALRGHSKAILCLIKVSDLLMSGSADQTVRIWQQGNDGRYGCLAILEGHTKPVKTLAAVMEDGQNGTVSIFSGSLDGEIKVWQVSMPKD